jgi:hypothetical protein
MYAPGFLKYSAGLWVPILNKIGQTQNSTIASTGKYCNKISAYFPISIMFAYSQMEGCQKTEIEAKRLSAIRVECFCRDRTIGAGQRAGRENTDWQALRLGRRFEGWEVGEKEHLDATKGTVCNCRFPIKTKALSNAD